MDKKEAGKVPSPMKAIVDALFCAFLLYTAIPAPRSAWNRAGIRYILCFKPLVGLLQMVLLLLWYELAAFYSLTAPLFASAAVLLPLLLGRGAQLSGFALVADVSLSRMPTQKKLMMMAEPKLGANGALWLFAYLLAQYGLFAQLYTAGRQIILLPAIGYIASAALSAISAMTVAPARQSGLGFALHQGGSRHTVLLTGAFSYLLAVFLCVSVSFLWGFVIAGICVALLFGHRFYCLRVFGGGSEALAGSFALLVDLAFLIVAVAVSL